MIKLSQEAEKIMIKRFGKDTVLAMATAENGVPYVRYVNAYYENGAFYIITHALSNKVKHIPVSYTHLDVYKRQLQLSLLICQLHFLCQQFRKSFIQCNLPLQSLGIC